MTDVRVASRVPVDSRDLGITLWVARDFEIYLGKSKNSSFSEEKEAKKLFVLPVRP
jgi:hypothetical protein